MVLVEEALIPEQQMPKHMMNAYNRFHEALFVLVNEATRDVSANMIIGDLELIKHMMLTAQMNMATIMVKDQNNQNEDPSIR